MALEKVTLDWLLRSKRPDGQTTRLLSLGYPDLLLRAEDIPFPGTFPIATDAEKIAAWHSWKGPVYDTGYVLSALDIDLTAIDIRPSRGAEKIVDLNQQGITGYWSHDPGYGSAFNGNELHGRFDIILDPGTLEHCFNIGQAFLNVAAMLAPGGTVIHTNPMSMVNHGFYNLSPTVYADFYGQNGFDVVYLGALAGHVSQRVQAEIDPVKRIQLAPEVSSLVVVRAPADWPGVAKFPVQTKYLKNPDLKA